MVNNIFVRLFRAVLVVMVFVACEPVSSNGRVGTAPKAQSGKDDCDDPDADINCSFVHMPASLSSVMTIGGNGEPGERMVISGTLLKPDGKTPYPDVILYAYHTDSKGYYSKNGQEKGAQKWHGGLHGWCKTDRHGKYEIRSIRPAPYPNNKIPAHIHAAVKIPGKASPYHVTDFVFSDDPLIDDQYRESVKGRTGGNGIVDLKKVGGVWTGRRDIILEP